MLWMLPLIALFCLSSLISRKIVFSKLQRLYRADSTILLIGDENLTLKMTVYCPLKYLITLALRAEIPNTFPFTIRMFTGKANLLYSPFTLIWLIINDFQVEFFSFNHRKQWKLSVCKKDINQVRVNALKIESRLLLCCHCELEGQINCFRVVMERFELL